MSVVPVAPARHEGAVLGAVLSWLSRFSFRTRVAALAAAAVGLAIALAAITSYFVVAHQLSAQVDTALRKDASSLQAQQIGFGTDARDLERRITQVAASDGDVIKVIEPDGSTLKLVQPDGSTLLLTTIPSTSQGLAPTRTEAKVAAAAAKGSTNTVIANGTIGANPYRVLTFPLGILNGTTGLAVMIAHKLASTNQTLAELKLVLFSVGLAGVALAIGLGLVVARVTMRPVTRLTAAAEHVAATQDLESRMDEEGDDELARLGHAFNGMLAALAASRTQQAQLISDAGHELRTPLTSLRTNVEVLMRVRDLPEADKAELLGDLRAQLEELTTLIGDVVDMARQEEVQPEPTEVRFDELVERAVERARRRNTSLSFDVVLDQGSIKAQPALLERAVLNVLDNAAKFSPPATVVEVRLQRGSRWFLDVRDHGPGIVPEDLLRVFDRFYRAPAARALPGSGLGLAIVKQVITSHGGAVGAYLPAGGGTLVHIDLPIVAEEEPETTSHAPPIASGVDPRAPLLPRSPARVVSDR